MRWAWVTGVAVVSLATSCSSSTTNESSGGASSGGASTGGGGSAGASSGGSAGAGGASVDAGTCDQKAELLCVSCCRTSDQAGYAAFVARLKEYVCSNSPCQSSCLGVCSNNDVTASCAKCILDMTSGPSVLNEVKTNCTSYGPPACVDWADCVLGCL